jgi:hypothetical protein
MPLLAPRVSPGESQQRPFSTDPILIGPLMLRDDREGDQVLRQDRRGLLGGDANRARPCHLDAGDVAGERRIAQRAVGMSAERVRGKTRSSGVSG